MSARQSWLAQWVLRPLLPVVLALAAITVLIWAIGSNPFSFFGAVITYGVGETGWQHSLELFAPLILVALGITVSFRAGLWNLGSDGQFMVAAVLVAGTGPMLFSQLPSWIATTVLVLIAMLTGAVWAFIPGWLKAARQANEIVTTLAMSFIGLGLANMLIRGPFHDPNVLVPQTQVLPQWALLPYLPFTRVHSGVLLALVLVIVGHIMLTRTSIGIRIDALGGSARAARLAGIRTGLVTVLVFVFSGAIIGIAASIDVLGVWGYTRTDWNPAYGMAVIPFVLIARFNILAALPLLGFYAVFATGATIAAQRAEISVDLMLVFVALILGFMALTEWWFYRRSDVNRAFWNRLMKRSVTSEVEQS